MVNDETVSSFDLLFPLEHMTFRKQLNNKQDIMCTIRSSQRISRSDDKIVIVIDPNVFGERKQYYPNKG
jgi:hypothetical protein